jgi:hypothetical protein
MSHLELSRIITHLNVTNLDRVLELGNDLELPEVEEQEQKNSTLAITTEAHHLQLVHDCESTASKR